MELDSLKDLYIDEIKDLYSAERQLVKALPKMARAAKDTQLQQAFRTHLKETAEHAARLEQICKDLGVSARGKKCVAEGVVVREARYQRMEVEVMQNLAPNRRVIIGVVLTIVAIAAIVLIVAYSGGGGGSGY